MARSDDDEDDSIMPGTMVDGALAGELTRRLRESFAEIGTENVSRPIWSDFREAISRRISRAEALAMVAERDTVYVLLNLGLNAWRCTGSQAAEFVDHLQPWEDWDVYVVDDTFSWCLARTHSQLGRRHIFLLCEAIAKGTA